MGTIIWWELSKIRDIELVLNVKCKGVIVKGIRDKGTYADIKV